MVEDGRTGQKAEEKASSSSSSSSPEVKSKSKGNGVGGRKLKEHKGGGGDGDGNNGDYDDNSFEYEPEPEVGILKTEIGNQRTGSSRNELGSSSIGGHVNVSVSGGNSVYYDEDFDEAEERKSTTTSKIELQGAMKKGNNSTNGTDDRSRDGDGDRDVDNNEYADDDFDS
jgi:hypothetical protein